MTNLKHYGKIRVVPQFFSHGKLWQTKFLFENETTCVNQLLILMLTNSICFLCVKICPKACIRNGTTMKKHKNSRQNKIKFERLKKWLCHISKQRNLSAKLKIITLQEHRNFFCLSVDVYCNHCNTVFEALGC